MKYFFSKKNTSFFLGATSILLCSNLLFAQTTPKKNMVFEQVRAKYQEYMNASPYFQYLQKKSKDTTLYSKEDRYDTPPKMAIEQDRVMTMDPNTGIVPIERNFETYKKIKQHFSNPQIKTAIAGVNWVERGPNNVGGRTRALIFDPNDATHKKVWAGSVGGGLWYNTDITSGSSVWHKVDDFWENIAIGCIAYDPSNTQIFYVGTGEGWWNTDAIRGDGIWISTNGGSTWSKLASTDNGNFYWVQKIAVTSTGKVFAATSSGLWVSTDHGSTWTKNRNNKHTDIEIASNGNIFVTDLDYYDDAWHGKIQKSTNGGTDWVDVTPAGGTPKRIEIAIAPSNPSIVYAVADGEEGNEDITWFKRSDNGGSSWTDLNIPGYKKYKDWYWDCFCLECRNEGGKDFTNGQAWYDLILAVHPTTPSTVFVGGVDLYRSTTSGSGWSCISEWRDPGSTLWVDHTCRPYVHADQHAICFRPGYPNEAVFGSDGGVSYSDNNGGDFSTRNNGYNVTQFYACAARNTAGSNYFLAGAQDNGTQQFTQAGLGSTSEATDGDGGYCFIDQNNSNYQITSYIHNNWRRSTDGGDDFSNITEDNSGHFINPADFDDNSNILYASCDADKLYRVTSGLTKSKPTVGGAGFGGATATEIKVSPYSAHTLFVGGSNTSIYKVTSANGTPTSVDLDPNDELPSGWVSCIDVGASDNELLVTFSNYGMLNVWETTDGGTHWASKEGNLPDFPVRSALYNPDNRDEVLLATEMGVWSTRNFNESNPDWQPTNLGLANVSCRQLQYRTADKLVAVATHGRGLYTTDIFAHPYPSADFTADKQYACVEDIISFTDNTLKNPISWTWTITPSGFSYVNSTTSHSQNPQVKFTSTGVYNVTLTATNANGSDTKTRTSYITITSPTGLTLTENFETFTYTANQQGTLANGWTTSPSNMNTFLWRVYRGGTPTSLTGPNVDHTLGTASGIYLFTEAENGTTGSVANLVSPTVNIVCSTSPILKFWYHMCGTQIGSIHIDVDLTASDNWQNDVFVISGQQQAQESSPWLEASVDLSAYKGNLIKVRFRAVRGAGNKGDMAIDDIRIINPLITSFTSSTQTICDDPALSVYFYDHTINNPTSWKWSFTPNKVTFLSSTSENSQNPRVRFDTTGLFKVKLITSNAYDSDTLEKSSYLTVTALSNLPVVEDFLSTINPLLPPTFPRNGWAIVNPDDDDEKWKVSVYGYNGIYNAKMEIYGKNQVGHHDELVSPSIDLSTVSSAQLQFYVAYRQKNINITDTLRVYISTNCGSSFTSTPIYNKSGSTLATVTPPVNASFTPPSEGGVWRLETINLASYVGQKIFIKFRATSAGGNNIYLENISLTGTPITPVAQFTSDVVSVCGSSPVRFTDNTYGVVSQYNWAFNPNTIAFINGTSASSKNPEVVFNDDTTYTVSLTATNATGNNTKTKQRYVSVTIPKVLPYSEDFEQATFPPDGWALRNPDHDTTWRRNTSARGNGSSTAAAFMNCYNYNIAGKKDEFVSPSISLSCLSSAKLIFNVAYRQYQTNAETLKVFISTDCGKTYIASPLYNKSGTTLATVTPSTTSSFVPSLSTHWRSDTVNLNAYIGQSIIVKFEVTNDYGNNIYIDDIKFEGMPIIGTSNFLASDTNICVGDTVYFTNASTNAISYKWLCNQLQFSTSANTYKVFSGAGDDTIRLVAFYCGGSDTLIKVIHTHALPSVTYTAPLFTICENEPIFALTGGSPLNGTYLGTGVDTNYFNPSVANAGSHVVCYIYTDENGCSSEAIDTIEVREVPNVDLGPDFTSCTTGILELDAGSGFDTYLWSNDSITQKILVDSNGVGMGTKIYTVLVSNNVGCYDRDTINVTFSPTYGVHLGSDTSICYGSSLMLNAGAGMYEYLWSTGDSTYQIQANDTSLGETSYNVSVLGLGGCASSDTIVVTVNPLPNPTCQIISNEVCYSAAPYELSGGLPGGGMYLGDGIDTNYFSAIKAGVGQHIIAYRYEDINGCVSTAFDTLVVNSLPVVSFNGAITTCLNLPAFSLSGGLPLGGAYSGAGVATDYFNPLIAGVGSHIVTYTYIDSNSCSNLDTDTVIVYSLPTVTFSSLDSICASEELLFALTQGSPGGGIYFGDGVSNNNFNPAAADSGTHMLSYVYADAHGCVDTAMQTIEVLALPVVTFAYLPGKCNSESGIFEFDQGSPFYGQYDGPGVSEHRYFNPQILDPGDYTITYTYADEYGCVNSASQTITVYPRPVIRFYLPTDVCADAPAVSIANGADPQGGTFGGDGINLSEMIFDPAVAGVGSHYISYEYSDAHSCYEYEVHRITVNALPVVTFDTVYPEICLFDSAFQLAGATPTGLKGIYSGPGVDTGYFHPALAGSGTHTVTYTYYDDVNGCSNNASTQISIIDPPVATLNPLPEMCVDASPYKLGGEYPSGGEFSGTGVDTGYFFPSIAGVGTHVITYSHFDSTGGNQCISVASQSITVSGLPTLVKSPLDDICVNATPFVLNFVTPTGGDYLIDGSVDSVFTPNTLGIGSHVIIYIYTDSNGCVGNIVDTVGIKASPTINLGADTIICAQYAVTLDAGIGNDSILWSNDSASQFLIVDSTGVGFGSKVVFATVYLNGCQATDSIVIMFDACTDNEDRIGGMSVKYHPNPVIHNLYIEIKGIISSPVEISISDALGKKMCYKKYTSSGTKQIDVSMYPKGIYTIETKLNNSIRTEKIVVQ